VQELDEIRMREGDRSDAPGSLARAGRLFGVLRDAVEINVRLDKRVNRERRRFTRQQTPLDFVSSTVAGVLGLPEDTITANIARVRGTTSEGAHVFLLELARRITRERSVARRAIDSGIRTEVRNAAAKGELETALNEVLDVRRRKALGARIRR